MLEFSMSQEDRNPYTVDSFWAGLSAPANDDDPEDYLIADAEAEQLVRRYGEYWVTYVNRLFYLRNWKEVHGEYPYELPYHLMQGLMYVDHECGLMKQFTMYDSKHKAEVEQQRAKARQNFAGKHDGKMNTF
jgi:hypothetical protein